MAGRGRIALRPVAFLLAIGVLGAAWIFFATPTTPARGPFAVPNPGAVPPVESLVGSVRYLVAREAAQRLVLDTVPPSRPARLLWLEGRPAHPLPGGGTAALDGTGGVLRFDADLVAHHVPLETKGREMLSLAPAPGGGLWLSDPASGLLRVGPDGRPVPLDTDDAGAGSLELSLPFAHAELATDPVSGALWLARSPDQVSYGWYPAGPAPVLVGYDSTGRLRDSLGTALVPAHALLTDLANAGRVLARGDTIFFAPLVRDEIVALSPAGDTMWVASRGLARGRREPRLTLVERKPMVDYVAVNLGLAFGLDGLLYTLGNAGDSTAAGRIDVFEPASGRLVRSVELTSPLPTVAVDEEAGCICWTPPACSPA